MIFLRQSTASQEALMGPFLDDTDGKTAETGLTIANTDIKIWKGGATSEVDKNSGGGTHVAGGRYSVVFDATDSNTVGAFEANVHVAGALPVKLSGHVLEEPVYDALFAPGAGTTAGLPANLIQSLGAAVTNEDGTLASATASTVTFPTTDSAGNSIPDDDRYTFHEIKIVAGTGVGQTVLTTSAGASARQYNVVASTMPVQPDNTSKYVVVGSWNANVTHTEGSSGGAFSNLYHADIGFARDTTNSRDEWTVVFFKNGVPLTAGITSPTIQVVKRADGTDLIASSALTQIGSTGHYKYDASGAERATLGEAVVAVVSGTIDGSARPFRRVVSRDS